MLMLTSIGLLGFIFCLILTPLVRAFSLKKRLLDHPDKSRKFHQRAIPRIGGAAIVLAYACAFILAAFMFPDQSPFAGASIPFAAPMVSAVGLMFLTGLADDLLTLRPWQKLVGQGLASGLAVSVGMHLSIAGGHAWLAAILSFLWLLLCTNAINLIDGVDGLATGVALIATITILTAAILGGQHLLAIVTAPLVGCLFAFLRYNFHPASIFLGDCGSLTIGFMLGIFALSWSQQAGSKIGIAAPLMALALPIVDVLLAICRRLLRSAPLFQGDRYHIHHKILARASTTRRAVFLLYGVCGFTCSLALLLSFNIPSFSWTIVALFLVLTVLAVRNLQYIEFIAAMRGISRQSILRCVKDDIYLDEFERALETADTVEDIWDVICIASEHLQIIAMTMELSDCHFSFVKEARRSHLAWEIIVPLGGKGKLRITHLGKAAESRLVSDVLSRFQDLIVRKEFSTEGEQALLPTLSYQGAA